MTSTTSANLPEIIFSETIANDSITIYPLQAILAPYEEYLLLFWWSLWLGVGCYMVLKYLAYPLIDEWVDKNKQN